MTPAAILALLNTLLGVAPQLVALYDKAKSGTPVSEADVNAAFAQYNTDSATLVAQINAATGAPPTPA